MSILEHNLRTENAALRNSVAELSGLLAEYLDPVLPDGIRSDAEWKVDFSARVRCALRQIAPAALPLTARAA